MLSSNFTSSVAIHAILTRWISSEWKSTIDAPEKGQAFGQASKRHLSDLAFDSEAVAECHKVDRYGRRVCGVAVAEVDVCLDQLRAGWAWLFTRYAHELPVSRRAAYVDAERGPAMNGVVCGAHHRDGTVMRGATAPGAAMSD